MLHVQPSHPHDRYVHRGVTVLDDATTPAEIDYYRPRAIGDERGDVSGAPAADRRLDAGAHWDAVMRSVRARIAADVAAQGDGAAPVDAPRAPAARRRTCAS